MSSIILLGIAVIGFVLAYAFYGRYISKRLGIDPNQPTPAHTMRDDVDYVPAKAPVLLGHHFASIAGAGPIVGPITAAVFGWVPVFLWIVLGSIFIGAVHDLTSIVASIRHKGQSIGVVIDQQIGRRGKQLFLIFAWCTLVLVVAAFTILVANTFVEKPPVGTASVFFILLAVLFGLSIYRMNAPLAVATIVGVALLLFCIWMGFQLPILLSSQTWTWILLVYIFAASVLPVWLLLQPRDYLNSFLLYMVLVGAFIGILMKNPSITMPAFIAFNDHELGLLFPILFVTVACGAISGFHSLVGSGTTAKQLNRETDAKPVGYGGMLIEGILAVIALITVATIVSGNFRGNPIKIFAEGVGSFVARLGIPSQVGVTFAALALSAFALTSLDTATRLGRFAFQEFFRSEKQSSWQTVLTNRYVATFFTVLPGGILAFSGSYKAIWPIFGSANQMLAALALLAGSVWLANKGQKNGFLRYPMYFMFAVTLTALVILVYHK
ncbi:MAG: carbon starvation protein A, partial [candidate division KSB1 bacterium]|nr:carbon starvation protein A [candidate division KSB1 bacterium]